MVKYKCQINTPSLSYLHLALTDEAAVDDMLIGMAIAPNFSTSANAHEYGSTDTVYLDNFLLKSLAYPAKKSYL
ncbi:hypothetical protein [Nostoc sp.]|uniref:hypothetical protein n=1 Tax=Nostoc sp. TaxID=1180 RepID=UPI002FFAC33D